MVAELQKEEQRARQRLHAADSAKAMLPKGMPAIEYMERLCMLARDAGNGSDLGKLLNDTVGSCAMFAQSAINIERRVARHAVGMAQAAIEANETNFLIES